MHKDSGARCLTAHYNGNYELMPPCVKCGNCGKWVRPEAMTEQCPGREEEK